jgi:formate dehydrogenase
VRDLHANMFSSLIPKMYSKAITTCTVRGGAGRNFAKVVSILYDDPVEGYPNEYSRSSVPKIESYPDQFGNPGQTAPSPNDASSFQDVKLFGSVSGELGLRQWLETNGHEYVVTADKDGTDSELESHLADAEIIISQPFWPAYMTAERIAKAPNLKMLLTAGVGSDHVDLEAACKHNITVTEVTYCNSISVAEHVVMMILSLVRNYIPSYNQVISGGWNIADCAQRAYDVEGMHVGTAVAAGRIGLAVLRRLKPFDCKLHYVGTSIYFFMSAWCT